MSRVERVDMRVQDRAIHCSGCEARIEAVLKRLPGVLRVEADHRTQKVSLTLDLDQVSVETVRRRLSEMGYETDPV